MSRCGDCPISKYKGGSCEEDLTYEQCIDVLQDELWSALDAHKERNKGEG